MASSTSFDPRPDGPKINADLQYVAHQVREEFADRLDSGAVDECLDRIAAKFDGAKVAPSSHCWFGAMCATSFMNA